MKWMSELYFSEIGFSLYEKLCHFYVTFENGFISTNILTLQACLQKQELLVTNRWINGTKCSNSNRFLFLNFINIFRVYIIYSVGSFVTYSLKSKNTSQIISSIKCLSKHFLQTNLLTRLIYNTFGLVMSCLLLIICQNNTPLLPIRRPTAAKSNYYVWHELLPLFEMNRV